MNLSFKLNPDTLLAEEVKVGLRPILKEKERRAIILPELGELELVLNEEGVERLRPIRIFRKFTPEVKVLFGGEGEKGKNQLVFSLSGTSFQVNVWRALVLIPRGRTKSYKEIASEINCSEGARAVGNAVSANPIFYFIPCHRIIKGDGQLGGYRWGVDFKAHLLREELRTQVGREHKTVKNKA